MYDIFGADWSGTMIIVVVAALMYLFLAGYYQKNLMAKHSIGLILAGIILVITFFPVVDTIIFEKSFPGTDGGLILSIFIMFGAFIAVVREYIELTTSEPI